MNYDSGTTYDSTNPYDGSASVSATGTGTLTGSGRLVGKATVTNAPSTFTASAVFRGSGILHGPTPAAPSALTLGASVQIGFQANPFAASVVWTDVTAYVEQVTTTLGRQHELQQVNPSTATIILSNQRGQFSPWNTASPYHYSGTGLVPGHPVRIVSTFAGVTYPVFYGYIKGIIPGYGLTKATMTFQCYDALALLNLNTMDVDTYSVYPLANATNYWPMNDPIGSAQAADEVGGFPMLLNHGLGVIFGGQGPTIVSTQTAASLGPGGSLESLASGALTNPCSVDGWVKFTGTPSSTAYLYIDGSISIGFTTAGLPFGGATGGTTITGTNAINDGNWHHLCATTSSTAFNFYVDGVLVGTGAGGSTYSPGFPLIDMPGVTTSFCRIALYPTALSATTVANQYAIGTAGFIVQDSGSRINAVLQQAGVPSILNNVGTGNVQVQGATSSLATTTVMSYLNTVVNTERGLLFQDQAGVIQFYNRHYPYENGTSNTSQATFGYATGQLHYFSTGLVPGEDDLDLWNNIPVQRQNGVIQTASDATSQAAYGRRTLTGYTSLLFTNDLDSLDLATGLLYQYKQPAPRIRSISMDSTIGNGANLPQMLGRQLLDRITVNWRPMDGSTVDFTQQSLIEQITHVIEPHKWTTTFALSPIGTETFWRWDISKWDVDVWGF